jgi:hypothetical protein
MQEDLGNIDLSALIAEWVPIGGLKPRFGWSDATSHRLVAQELVEARKVGGKTLVNLASVRRFLADQPLPNLKQSAGLRPERCKQATEVATA